MTKRDSGSNPWDMLPTSLLPQLSRGGFQVVRKMKSKIPALCKRKIDLGNYFLAAQLFKLQSSVGIGLFFYTRLKAVQLLIV